MKLFDVPQLTLHGEILSSPLVGKGLALFAYVVLQQNPISRAKLLDLLWSESTEKQARENLRSLLYSLRRVLGDYLIVTRQTVAFNREMPYWLDVEVLVGIESCIDVEQHPQMLAQALDLFNGDFLSGIEVQNALVFDNWLAEQRRRFVDMAVAGRQKLVRFFFEEKHIEEALVINRRLLELVPWHEDAHRMQMRLLAASGQRDAALAHYERCKTQLLEELNAPPSPETTALYEQVRAQPDTIVPSNPPLPPATVDAKAEEIRPLLSQGAMPSPRWFVGREDELQTLHRWLVTERCRVVSILGMGGQGKTTLAARFVECLVADAAKPHPAFEGIIWHSLLTAPSLEDILRDLIYQLSDQQVYKLPATLDRQLDLLMDYLTQRRFLLVLDNVESISIAAESDTPGSYAGYVHLWQLLLTRNHRSSLLLTSREWTNRLRNEPEVPGIYRSLVLEGLSLEASASLMKKHGIHGDIADFDRLQRLYSGNPLALDLAAQTIDELFGGDTNAFLAEETPFLADIGVVLAHQFARLSPLEQEILTWLALEQIPVTSAQLYEYLLAAPSKSVFFGALRSLLNRALVQQDGAKLGLQDVILEFVRSKLLEDLYQELTDPALAAVDTTNFGPPAKSMAVAVGTLERIDTAPPTVRVTQMLLNRYPLSRAQANEDALAAQERMVVKPLFKRLAHYWGGSDGIDKLIRRMLISLRYEQLAGAPLTNGYAVGNLLTLLQQYSTQAVELDYRAMRNVDKEIAELSAYYRGGGAAG